MLFDAYIQITEYNLLILCNIFSLRQKISYSLSQFSLV